MINKMTQRMPRQEEPEEGAPPAGSAVAQYRPMPKTHVERSNNNAPAAVVAGLAMGAGLPVSEFGKAPRKYRTCKLCTKNGGTFAATCKGKNGAGSTCQHFKA